MQRPIIEQVQLKTSGSNGEAALPLGFMFDVAATRLLVVAPMNPEWSETTKLPVGMRLEVFDPSARGASPSRLASLAAGAPSGVTFRKQLPRGT